MEHQFQHTTRAGVTLSAGTQRSEPPAAMGSGGPHGTSWLDTHRRSVVALLLGRRPVTPCAGRRPSFTTSRGAIGSVREQAGYAELVRVGLESRTLHQVRVGPLAGSAPQGGAGTLFCGGVAQLVEHWCAERPPSVAGSSPAPASISRSACRRAAASPMAERQGGLSNWWTSHRPGWSDLAVRRRVAHGIQPKSRAAGERSTASYTACASSARRDSLLHIFPKRPARGARRRGDGRGARILLPQR